MTHASHIHRVFTKVGAFLKRSNFCEHFVDVRSMYLYMYLIICIFWVQFDLSLCFPRSIYFHISQRRVHLNWIIFQFSRFSLFWNIRAWTLGVHLKIWWKMKYFISKCQSVQLPKSRFFEYLGALFCEKCYVKLLQSALKFIQKELISSIRAKSSLKNCVKDSEQRISKLIPIQTIQKKAWGFFHQNNNFANSETLLSYFIVHTLQITLK